MSYCLLIFISIFSKTIGHARLQTSRYIQLYFIFFERYFQMRIVNIFSQFTDYQFIKNSENILKSPNLIADL